MQAPSQVLSFAVNVSSWSAENAVLNANDLPRVHSGSAAKTQLFSFKQVHEMHFGSSQFTVLKWTSGDRDELAN